MSDNQAAIDPLEVVFNAQVHNAQEVDRITALIQQGEAHELRVLKSTPASIANEDFDSIQQDFEPLNTKLGINEIFAFPSFESLNNSALQEYSHSLAVESISARLKTIMQALRRMGIRILNWIKNIIERVNTVIEGTYGRAKKAKQLLTANARSIHVREVTVDWVLDLYTNGTRAVENEELVNLPGQLERLLAVSLEDSARTVDGFKQLFMNPTATRDSVMKSIVSNQDMKLLASKVDNGEMSITYSFPFGLKGTRLQIRRPLIDQQDFDPQAYSARIVKQKATKRPGRVKTLEASAAINICTNIMDVIDSIKASRKRFADIENGVKAIIKASETPPKDEAVEMVERRRDLMAISKLLMGELGTVYKFIYVTTRDLMDFIDLLLANPRKLAAAGERRKDAKKDAKETKKI